MVPKGGSDGGYNNSVNEAVKRNLDTSFLGNLREMKKKELEVVQSQLLEKMEKENKRKKNGGRGGTHRNDIIEIDDCNVDKKKKKNVGKLLSVDMFERVDKK